MIKGVYADEANKLNPEQWVNIYHVDFMGEAIFHSSCQVKDLNLSALSKVSLVSESLTMITKSSIGGTGSGGRNLSIKSGNKTGVPKAVSKTAIAPNLTVQ